MNFRSIDPRDSRAGLGGTGKADEAVWDEFFDPIGKRLRSDALEREYERLWGDDRLDGGDAAASAESLDQEVRRLAKKSLEQLMNAYRKSAAEKPSRRPPASKTTTTTYDRDPLVVAIAKRRAENRCEVPDCKHPQFRGPEGELYCEVHHLTPLAEGGDDTIENTACVCPSHHRELHYGSEAGKLRALLQAIRAKKAG